MVGLPWSQHVAFLDDRALLEVDSARDRRHRSGELADHPALLMFALGNEIPPGVVRWHGRLRVERFLRRLYTEAKHAAPDRLFTYVNFPPTEFLDLSFFDVCAFNVYLHREQDLRAYLARLQHIAGQKPLLLAEAGVDSIREGEEGQARLTAMHLRAAFEEGACGAVAFAWTDEWWRGGHDVDDWAFGLVDRDRRPKPAAAAVAGACSPSAPFPEDAEKTWPRVSVVVCAYNAVGHARRLSHVARAAELSRFRGHRRQRRLARSDGRHRAAAPGGAPGRSAERRPERRAQHRAVARHAARSSPTPTPTPGSTPTG